MSFEMMRSLNIWENNGIVLLNLYGGEGWRVLNLLHEMARRTYCRVNFVLLKNRGGISDSCCKTGMGVVFLASKASLME